QIAKTMRGPIEEHIKSKSEKALADAGADFSYIRVKVDHTHVVPEGTVDTEEARQKAVKMIDSGAFGAYLPDGAAANISVKATLPPLVILKRQQGGSTVQTSGILGSEEEVSALNRGIGFIKGVQAVDSDIQVNSRHLYFDKSREFNELAADLLSKSDFACIRLENNLLTVEGEVDSPLIKDELMKRVAALGIANVTDKVGVIEREATTPAEFHLVRNRFGITARGKFADDATLNALTNMIARQGLAPAGSGSANTKEMRVEGGVAPAKWMNDALNLVPYVFKQAKSDVEAHFTADGITFKGYVDSEQKKTDIASAVQGLGSEYPGIAIIDQFIVDAPVTAAPVVPVVIATHKGQEIIVEGTLPSREAADVVINGIVSSSPNFNVVDRITINPAVTDQAWYATMPRIVSEVVAKAKGGRVEVSGQKVVMTGMTTQAERDQIGALAGTTFPSNFTIENLLTYPDKEIIEQKAELTKQLKLNPVYFDTSSDVIRSSELSKVTAAADAINAASPEFKLTVGGYADNRGNAAANEQLSIRRATSVRNKLIELGVAAERMEVEYFGEDLSERAVNDLQHGRRVEVQLSK
ncbi:MAG: OmpA family protein, partial [Verrucomicrobiota bacterium]